MPVAVGVTFTPVLLVGSVPLQVPAPVPPPDAVQEVALEVVQAKELAVLTVTGEVAVKVLMAGFEVVVPVPPSLGSRYCLLLVIQVAKAFRAGLATAEPLDVSKIPH